MAWSQTPAAPDYANPAHWAALPTRRDAADSLPTGVLPDRQATAPADVFFVHPTTLTDDKDSAWNANLADTALNRRTDLTTILNQASAFNAAGRVYAPRYRQAHLRAFFTTDTLRKRAALDLAYADVRAAFAHYLAQHNQGRPIILASHSQGSLHTIRLVKEFFDGQPLQKQLVVAYLVGWWIGEGTFGSVPLSQDSAQTGGFVTWNTYARGHYPPNYQTGLDHALCVNPLTWRADTLRAPRADNLGGVNAKFAYVPRMTDAQVHRGMLWIDKPRVPGRAFVYWFYPKRWHVADYNLFYGNVRANAVQRVAAYLQASQR